MKCEGQGSGFTSFAVCMGQKEGAVGMGPQREDKPQKAYTVLGPTELEKLATMAKSKTDRERKR